MLDVFEHLSDSYICYSMKTSTVAVLALFKQFVLARSLGQFFMWPFSPFVSLDRVPPVTAWGLPWCRLHCFKEISAVCKVGIDVNWRISRLA